MNCFGPQIDALVWMINGFACLALLLMSLMLGFMIKCILLRR